MVDAFWGEALFEEAEEDDEGVCGHAEGCGEFVECVDGFEGVGVEVGEKVLGEGLAEFGAGEVEGGDDEQEEECPGPAGGLCEDENGDGEPCEGVE